MSSLRGTKTEKNLLTAFAGESQARNRYTYFSSAARKEGFVQIADIFEETANQEREHAKRFFKFLEGGDVLVEAAFPAGVIGTTAENLEAAAAGEHEEWESMYPGFAATARTEVGAGNHDCHLAFPPSLSPLKPSGAGHPYFFGSAGPAGPVPAMESRMPVSAWMFLS